MKVSNVLWIMQDKALEYDVKPLIDWYTLSLVGFDDSGAQRLQKIHEHTKYSKSKMNILGSPTQHLFEDDYTCIRKR